MSVDLNIYSLANLRLSVLKVLFTLSESGNESEKIISKIDQRINNIKEFSLSLDVKPKENEGNVSRSF